MKGGRKEMWLRISERHSHEDENKDGDDGYAQHHNSDIVEHAVTPGRLRLVGT